MVVLKAMGVQSDQEAITLVGPEPGLAALLAPSLEEAASSLQVFTQLQALEFLGAPPPPPPPELTGIWKAEPSCDWEEMARIHHSAFRVNPDKQLRSPTRRSRNSAQHSSWRAARLRPAAPPLPRPSWVPQLSRTLPAAPSQRTVLRMMRRQPSLHSGPDTLAATAGASSEEAEDAGGGQRPPQGRPVPAGRGPRSVHPAPSHPSPSLVALIHCLACHR